MLKKLSKEKVWFIILDNKQEGPYSLFDLKNDRRFTPDTLVWRNGFKEWMLARNVKEIADVFKDNEPSKAIHEPFKGKKVTPDIGKEVTLALNQDPYQWMLWILIFVLIIFYIIYLLNQ